MNMQVLARSLAVTLALGLPVVGGAQPDPAAPPVDVPPHLIRLEGTGAQVMRDGAATPIDLGDPVLFGDRLDIGTAYGQLLWGDGTRVALDRGARLEALGPDLLAVTLGRALVTRPASATTALRVDTPAGSFTLAPGGEYRFSLEGDVTTLGVGRGHADVQTGMGDRAVEAGEQVAIRDGLAPEAPRRFNGAGYDSFVEWANTPAAAPAAGAPLDTFQDPRFEAYSDVFNREGAWETDAQLGSVWYPTVAADWRPYADGYWQSYGPQSQWLWVGRDTWSWPTHHYGRWGVNGRGRWYWTPGQQFAPAWVSWSVGPGYVGWTPLGSQDRPVSSWDSVAHRRGAYPGGTLDPSRAWTVIPSDRFGQRDRMGAYAVDPRTLDNLSAFVSQRVGPPVRYGTSRGGGYVYGSGSGSRPYGGSRGTTVYGPGGYSGGVGPTRVEPPAPGYGGPTPPPDDPYERAQRAVAPRSRQRPPAQTGAPGATRAPDASPAPPAEAPAPAAPGASRPRTPPREAPQSAPPPAARESAPAPPPAAEPAPPARDRTPPPDAATGRSQGTSSSRRAVPRP